MAGLDPYRAILACNVPVELSDTARLSAEAEVSSCPVLPMEAKAQECRIELLGGGGQNYPSPHSRVFLACGALRPQDIISTSGSDASGSSGVGGGVICSPGALESLRQPPPPPSPKASGRGRAPSAESQPVP